MMAHRVAGSATDMLAVNGSGGGGDGGGDGEGTDELLVAACAATGLLLAAIIATYCVCCRRNAHAVGAGRARLNEAQRDPSNDLDEEGTVRLCALLQAQPWIERPLTAYGFKRGGEVEEAQAECRAVRVWHWLRSLHWWSLLLLSLQVANMILLITLELVAIAGELDIHSINTYALPAEDIPYALDIDTDEWDRCCAPGGGGSAASRTHCVVPKCLPLFAEHPGWQHEWVFNHAQLSDSPAPVADLTTKPDDYTVTARGWQCDQDSSDWAEMEERGLAFRQDTKYHPCNVYTTGPNHPHGLVPIQVPQLCAPASYCAVVRAENERMAGTVLAFVLGIVLIVLLVVNRILVLKLISGGLDAAGRGLIESGRTSGLQVYGHLGEQGEMKKRVKDKVATSARRDFILLWTALPVLISSYVLFWFVAISDPLDRGFWEFTAERVQIEMPSLKPVPIWLAIPMYLCLFLLPYTSVGATAVLLRTACIAHEEHAQTITKFLMSQSSADRTVDSAVNEFRCLAEALKGTSQAWKSILTVQVGIFATIILIAVGGYVGTGHVPLEHTLRAIAMCWPLSFNFRTILNLNDTIKGIPKQWTQKPNAQGGFSAAERCIFAQEFARLDLVIKGPGFGGGVELTSGRMWAAAASGMALLTWTFIKTLMSWS
jgi:hypothetical protein